MNYSDIYTHTSDKTIHSISCGSGDVPMHFLHANGFCAGAYLPFLSYFDGDFRIIATDIPGHGDSDHHGYQKIRHWNIFIDDIKEAIVQHMNTPVIGVGHSLGAVTTYLAAARYPELFSRIVLIDPVIMPAPILLLASLMKKTGFIKYHPLAMGARRRKTVFNGKKEAYHRFASGRGMFKGWPDDFIKSYSKHGLKTGKNGTATLKCDPETEAQIYESLLNDIWDYPKHIHCPVLVIRGEKSDTFSRSAAKRLQKELSDCTLETIPDSGHFVPMEQAIACHKSIQHFVFNSA